MENYHSRSGITISLPPFDASSDQLYLSIKSLVNQKFVSLSRRMDRLETRQDEIVQSLNRIQETLLQVLEQNIAHFYHQPSIDASHQDNIDLEYNNTTTTRSEESPTTVSYFNETAHKDPLPNTTNILPPNYHQSADDNEPLASDLTIVKTESVVIPHQTVTTEAQSSHSNNGYTPKAAPKRPIVTKLSLGSVNSRLEPRVVFDPECRKQIFVGGQAKFKMPLWIYLRCLELVRSNTVECGPRLCLLLLQAMYGRNYMLTHNYNGTFGKEAIGKATLNAILNQAKMQFDSDYFFTNSVSYSKFRDYINNAFRVVAFQMRRGKRSILPFWDSDGEPIKTLEPPSTYRLNLAHLGEEEPSTSKVKKLDVPALTPANQQLHKTKNDATLNEDSNAAKTNLNVEEAKYNDDPPNSTVIYLDDDRTD